MTERGDTFDLLWEVMQSMGRTVHEAAAALDLSPMQAMLLDRLPDDGPTPMTDLARTLHCDKSNLTGLVDALEARGVVSRTTPTGDRRVRAVVTSEHGRALRADLRHRLREDNPVLSRLSTTDEATLRHLLTRLLDS